MLRISEIKLPLDHDQAELDAAVRARLQSIDVPSDQMIGYTVYRRAHDARKRGDIKLTYIVDVALSDEATVLTRIKEVPH